MKIVTVSQLIKNRKTTTFLIEHNLEVKNITVNNSRTRNTIDTIKYAINKTIGPHNGRITFIGNKRVNNHWITEWMVK